MPWKLPFPPLLGSVHGTQTDPPPIVGPRLMIQAARPALVVVGTGMAGAKVVEEVISRDPDRFTIRMFGAEPHGTYNRILLSSVMAGFRDPCYRLLDHRSWFFDY